MAMSAPATARATTVLYDDGLAHVIDAGSAHSGSGFILYDNAAPPPLITSIEILTGGLAEDIYAFDHSVVVLSGGSLTLDLEVYDHASLTVSDGAVGGAVRAYSSTAIQLSGGAVADCVEVYNDVTAQLAGATLTGGLAVYNAVEAALSAGAVTGRLDAYNDSHTTVTGGHVGGGLYAFDDAAVDLYGTAFNYPAGPIGDLIGTLTGTLADGSSINSDFEQEGPGQIVLHVVPEPVTALGVVAGAAGLGAYIRTRRAI